MKQDIFQQRQRVVELNKKLKGQTSIEAKQLLSHFRYAGQKKRVDLRRRRMGL